MDKKYNIENWRQQVIYRNFKRANAYFDSKRSIIGINLNCLLHSLENLYIKLL